MQNFSQILFVMWRETVEAMLVVGILHTWLSHNAEAKRGLLYLWGGVVAGLIGACLLGLGIETMDSALAEEGRGYFQAILMFVAAALIVQMVLWMRRNGRRLKRDMEQSLSISTKHQHWWGVFSLAAIAVAREGSETVVFLSGLAMGAQGLASLQFWVALILGVILAGGTFYLLQLGGKVFSWRIFFKATEVLLLLLGCALLINSVDRLIDVQFLPTLKTQLWDSSFFLDDGSVFGGIVSSFTGYRSRPPLTSLLVFVGYWIGVLYLLRMTAPAQKTA